SHDQTQAVECSVVLGFSTQDSLKDSTSVVQSASLMVGPCILQQGRNMELWLAHRRTLFNDADKSDKCRVHGEKLLGKGLGVHPPLNEAWSDERCQRGH